MRGRLGPLLLSLIATAALAVDVAGVKLSDKTNVGGQDLTLNGAGVRSRAVFKVYVASLYLPSKATTTDAVLAKGPRRIQLNLLRNVSSDQFADALTDALKANNSAAELAAIKAQTDQMIAMLKSLGDVKEGDAITFDFVDGATRIGFNGAAKGSVDGEAFNRALTKAWLGDKPVQDDLKKAMLGG
jgi:hypothetical protein